MGAASSTDRIGKPTLNTRSQPQSQLQANRFWLWLTWLAALITIGAVGFYLVKALEWRNHPFFGTMVSYTTVVDAGMPSGRTSWPGLDAGLQHMDKILSINGKSLSASPTDYETARENYHAIMNTFEIGDQITVEFSRDADPDAVGLPGCTTGSDSTAICQVEYTLTAFPAGDFLAFFVIPLVSGVIVLAIGLAVLYWRSSLPAARLAAFTFFLIATFMAGIFDLGTMHSDLTRLWLLAVPLSGGALVTLSMIFPLRLSLLSRQRIALYVPFAVSIIIALIVIAGFDPIRPQDYAESITVTTSTALIGLVILFFRALYQSRQATSSIVRDQSNTIMIGVGLVIIPALVWLFSRVAQAFDPQATLPFSIEATMPFFIIPVISIAYAFFQYRRFDTDRIITQSIAYVLMAAGLVVGYTLLVLGVSLLTGELMIGRLVNANNPLLVALTIFFISVAFLPLRTRLQDRIDEIYYRSRRDYQRRLETFAQKLTSLTTQTDIIKEFRALVKDTISPTSIFIFLPDRNTRDFVAFGDPVPDTDVCFSADSELVEMLKARDQLIYLELKGPLPPEIWVERSRLMILGSRLLAGLTSGERLNGIVSIGPPRSGAKGYDYEEIRFVNNLISQLVNAIERAQVIASLQTRVRELDVLSQVGQAVNFTIEFDDLLELISAQTGKLIDASNFYIALHDPTTDQFFFAFFLEKDERYRDKENVRWPVGNDLFSEVFKTVQPLCVDDYAQALAQRNLSIVLESPDLRAWMGVPLISGPRTLGVVAVAQNTPGQTFGEDQLKIFGDIGALAATSLEKARLFAETNVRARQLTVLNDISRQLVATESDVEKLLDIITSSAVDILNAEAGSLLLTTDDDSGDLQFRVVIGGSGQELIGSRLKAGQGLVGQVAKSGKPVISNDASHDPRHAKEVSEGTFHTSSILAVPMIAKDRVVGVLEVLNKKDGTIYIEEDVDLLTTFAGQAAIAIENARLFQMTDLQLEYRVQELEALERIDVELNRTLDLKKVAEITVRWAIANSAAEAGALGIVTGVPPVLEIVANYGYREKDYPDGAEGMIWPLDRGIVKRVIRTRQADFAPDTSIDPDYIPSLRRSLSQITIPMLSGADINAILILETNSEPRFTLSDWGFAQRLAEHASIAIANAQLYSELTRADETKSEFMAFAAHELKNPLASVKGYADLINTGMSGEINAQVSSFLGVIRSNADRMQTIIDDLRDIARIDARQLNVELAPISINEVAVETLRPFAQQLENKQQEVRTSIPDDLPPVMGDKNRLIQVLTNLVSNAHKYSPEASTIEISARVDENFRNPEGQRLGAVVHVSVKDSGIGMNEEDLQKLFKVRYFRSSNQDAHDQPGTGLGMMITQHIIDLHKGEIWVDSELGKGSTFHFVIPLVGKTEQEPETEPASN